MSDAKQDVAHMRHAIALAAEGIRDGGGPFGAVVVKDGRIVGEGCNRVTSGNDPTAHAEIVAIREACAALGDFSLADCDIYASCEPCPMCLSAIYWARIGRIFYAATRQDAAHIGFDDDHIYRELARAPVERSIPTLRMDMKEARAVFDAWNNKSDKIPY